MNSRMKIKSVKKLPGYSMKNDDLFVVEMRNPENINIEVKSASR